VVHLASKFLVCGTIRADLPYEKVWRVRDEYRKIGLGLMGLHEWLLSRGYGYEVTDELRLWLSVYADESERAARGHAERFYLATPRNYRAIAPTGTLGLLAG
jgi:ribonucleoside-diphosphate reductase alpha chain